MMTLPSDRRVTKLPSFPLLRNRYTFGTKIPFNCVERKILHPTLVNVVLHRDAEAFENWMLVDVGAHGFVVAVAGDPGNIVERMCFFLLFAKLIADYFGIGLDQIQMGLQRLVIRAGSDVFSGNHLLIDGGDIFNIDVLDPWHIAQPV